VTIVDTCFLIDLIRGDAGALRIAEETEELRTTSISAAEFLLGGRLSKRPDLYATSRAFLGYFPILPFDDESAVVYADIAGALQESGTRISSFDELIAAIAIRHADTLVTRDSHFGDIPGLSVSSY
jgi:tRNA(fMet)-specific endonuclease VapC